MVDVLDAYFDQFQVNIGPWGTTLNFELSAYQPPEPGSQPQKERVATVRTSLEHLKTMTLLIQRQLAQYDRDNGITVAVPTRVLSALGIAPEDWDTFWKS